MGRAKEIAKKQLLELDPVERAEVAEEAFASLADSNYGELSPAWEEEIQRRIEEIEAGRAELIPADQVFAEIESELRARRGGR